MPSPRQASHRAVCSTSTPSCDGRSRPRNAGGSRAPSVATLVDPPRVPHHDISPLTPEQAHQLIDAAANDRYRALWVTALATGLRQGELLALRWQDVDVEQ